MLVKKTFKFSPTGWKTIASEIWIRKKNGKIFQTYGNVAFCFSIGTSRLDEKNRELRYGSRARKTRITSDTCVGGRREEVNLGGGSVRAHGVRLDCGLFPFPLHYNVENGRLKRII